MTSDLNGVLQAVYDDANARLLVTQVAGPTGTTKPGTDANGVLAAVFQNGTLRVVVVS